MRILLDESLPIELRDELPGHSVSSVREIGWSALKNGELLLRAAAQLGRHPLRCALLAHYSTDYVLSDRVNGFPGRWARRSLPMKDIKRSIWAWLFEESCFAST